MKIREKEISKIFNLKILNNICSKYTLTYSENFTYKYLLMARAFNIDVSPLIIFGYLNNLITTLLGEYLNKHSELQLVDLQRLITNRKLGLSPNFLPIDDNIAKDIYLLCDIYYKVKAMI